MSIDGCVGDIKGNLTGEAAATLRLVYSDQANDLALLQGPARRHSRRFAKIRDRSIRSGDSVTRDRLSLPRSADVGLHRHNRHRELAERHEERHALPADQRARSNPATAADRCSTPAARSSGMVAAKLNALGVRPRHRQYSGEHQLRHQDRRAARLPRQQRRALRDRRARCRAQDHRDRRCGAGLHAADLLHRDASRRTREAVAALSHHGRRVMPALILRQPRHWRRLEGRGSTAGQARLCTRPDPQPWQHAAFACSGSYWSRRRTQSIG